MMPEYLWLWLWGSLVGLDLITGPQVMIARPLVAGAGAGWIMGDPITGVTVGVVMELCAFEITPFGASRYSDYGLGSVIAAAIAAGAPAVVGMGVGIGVGLVVALLGEAGVQMVRRANTADSTRHTATLAQGDPAVVRRMHYRGLVRDALRGAVLIGLALPLVALIRGAPTIPLRAAVGATAVVLGVAAGTAGVSVMRYTAGTVRGPWYLGAGVLGGLAWVVLR